MTAYCILSPSGAMFLTPAKPSISLKFTLISGESGRSKMDMYASMPQGWDRATIHKFIALTRRSPQAISLSPS